MVVLGLALILHLCSQSAVVILAVVLAVFLLVRYAETILHESRIAKYYRLIVKTGLRARFVAGFGLNNKIGLVKLCVIGYMAIWWR